MQKTENKKIEFLADSLKVNGPRVDGGYSITLSVGEYEQAEVSRLINIPQQTPLSVVIGVQQ